jgi:uncharacterized protein
VKQLVAGLEKSLAGLKTDSAHDIGHLRRVHKNALDIASGEARGNTGADTTLLTAAAYLHDLVNMPKNHPERATASSLSAAAAAPILQNSGFDADQIRATCHAITAHSYSAKIRPETPEAKILQDADRLDALGAAGIARTFAVSGALDRPLFDPDDPFACNRPLDDTRFALDHWPVKLLRLPDLMNTATGKSLANRRCKIMYNFIDALADEIGHPAPTHTSRFFSG